MLASIPAASSFENLSPPHGLEQGCLFNEVTDVCCVLCLRQFHAPDE
ncbi:MAG: hypothetical protein WCS99_11835 [Limisphaerales bacterium]